MIKVINDKRNRGFITMWVGEGLIKSWMSSLENWDTKNENTIQQHNSNRYAMACSLSVSGTMLRGLIMLKTIYIQDKDKRRLRKYRRLRDRGFITMWVGEGLICLCKDVCKDVRPLRKT